MSGSGGKQQPLRRENRRTAERAVQHANGKQVYLTPADPLEFVRHRGPIPGGRRRIGRKLHQNIDIALRRLDVLEDRAEKPQLGDAEAAAEAGEGSLRERASHMPHLTNAHKQRAC